MDLTSRLEVKFYDKKTISIDFQHAGDNKHQKVAELAMFIMFSLRQLSNLGVRHPSADRLAAVLFGTPDGIEKLAADQAKLDFALVPDGKDASNKCFVAYLDYSNAGAVFRMDAKGFTFLAIGVGHYAPLSVVAFLTHLARKRKDDPDFLRTLGNAACFCGSAHIEGELKVENRGEMGLIILAATCEGYLAEQSQ